MASFKRKVYDFLKKFGYRYNLSIYDKGFFEFNQKEGLSMAEWFIPLLIKQFNPTSLADVGCGTGHYLKVAKNMGIKEIFGIEGSDSAFEQMLVGKEYVRQGDLRDKIGGLKKYDLVISIEVAEHIDEEYVDNYLFNLSSLSNRILMTAAPPGQGGTAHVNEKPHSWWIEKFKNIQYEFDKQSTDLFRKGVAQAIGFKTDWFEPNIMVFKKM